MKTEQKFYTTIEIEGETKHLHFSNNFWYLLWKETGEEFTTMFNKFQGSIGEEQLEFVLDIVVCAMSAYDYENGITPNYNKWHLRNIDNLFTAENTAEIIKMMLLSKGVDLDEIQGNKEAREEEK